MKNFFFYAFGGVVGVGLLVWGLYMIWDALVQVYRDWRLGRELDQIQSESASRREQKRLQNEQRLANGCEHNFDGGVVGMPPGACSKCGIEKDKPTGGCDHRWRVKPGAVPNSVCEKCGKTYNPLETPPSLPRR